MTGKNVGGRRGRGGALFMQSKDYYVILGVSRSATKQVRKEGGRERERGGGREGVVTRFDTLPTYGPLGNLLSVCRPRGLHAWKFDDVSGCGYSSNDAHPFLPSLPPSLPPCGFLFLIGNQKSLPQARSAMAPRRLQRGRRQR